jgi:predicted TPR repeat methyltransferase
MVLDWFLLCWHRFKTRAKMDRVFSRGKDPYGYQNIPYERGRLKAMEKAVGGKNYSRALEIGCAEGVFTERLVGLVGALTVLDISRVALDRARQHLLGWAVEFIEADLRDWSPPRERLYGLIVLGDVLYYLDKPLVRRAFEGIFPKISGWLEPGGRVLLAHGFATDEELAHRRGFRERFKAQGLQSLSEDIIGEPGPVRCLLSVLEKPSV